VAAPTWRPSPELVEAVAELLLDNVARRRVADDGGKADRK
jgi:hypothetical protein